MKTRAARAETDQNNCSEHDLTRDFRDAGRFFENLETTRFDVILLGFRYSSSFLAISANRLAIRPPAKTRGWRRAKRGAPLFVDEGGVLLSGLR